jgi:hypothetical protein
VVRPVPYCSKAPAPLIWTIETGLAPVWVGSFTSSGHCKKTVDGALGFGASLIEINRDRRPVSPPVFKAPDRDDLSARLPSSSDAPEGDLSSRRVSVGGVYKQVSIVKTDYVYGEIVKYKIRVYIMTAAFLQILTECCRDT